jgi:hypothetical protein
MRRRLSKGYSVATKLIRKTQQSYSANKSLLPRQLPREQTQSTSFAYLPTVDRHYQHTYSCGPGSVPGLML